MSLKPYQDKRKRQLLAIVITGLAVSLTAALYLSIIRPPSYAPRAATIPGDHAGRLAVDLDRRARWFAVTASRPLSAPVSVEVSAEEANAYVQTSSAAQAHLAEKGIQNPAMGVKDGELILSAKTDFHGVLVPITVRGGFTRTSNGDAAFKVRSALMGRVALPDSIRLKIESAVNDPIRKGIGSNRISQIRIDGDTIMFTASPK